MTRSTGDNLLVRWTRSWRATAVLLAIVVGAALAMFVRGAISTDVNVIVSSVPFVMVPHDAPTTVPVTLQPGESISQVVRTGGEKIRRIDLELIFSGIVVKQDSIEIQLLDRGREQSRTVVPMKAFRNNGAHTLTLNDGPGASTTEIRFTNTSHGRGPFAPTITLFGANRNESPDGQARGGPSQLVDLRLAAYQRIEPPSERLELMLQRAGAKWSAGLPILILGSVISIAAIAGLFGVLLAHIMMASPLRSRMWILVAVGAMVAPTLFLVVDMRLR